MKNILLLAAASVLLFTACNSHEFEKQKGISLDQTVQNTTTNDLENNQAFKDLITRPGEALLTRYSDHQLVTIFKLNYSPKSEEYFTGSNAYRY